LRSRRRFKGQDKAKVPAYIVTFSDMITLLLTFFVMLLSLAQVQDPELFETGRDSFIQSMRCLGIGFLLGATNKSELGKTKAKYSIDKPEERATNRNIDVLEEQLREHYLRAEQMMDSVTSETISGRTTFSTTNIHFARGETLLDEVAERFLKEFGFGLQQEPFRQGFKVYVLGLANDVPGSRAQWILSARRARAAADFLKSTLPLDYSQSVYSLGAGAGGEWSGSRGPISKQSQILIMVLRTG